MNYHRSWAEQIQKAMTFLVEQHTEINALWHLMTSGAKNKTKEIEAEVKPSLKSSESDCVMIY